MLTTCKHEQLESELWRINADVEKLVAANIYVHIWQSRKWQFVGAA